MCSPNLRSVSLSLSHSNCRSCQCKPILSVRRLKMVVWGSFPPFLSSLRTRGVRMSFFLFSLRRRTWSPFSSKFFFVLLAQVSSAAIFFFRKIVTRNRFFFHGNFFWGFFSLKLENQVAYRNFQGEQKLRISAKMRKIGSTALLHCLRLLLSLIWTFLPQPGSHLLCLAKQKISPHIIVIFFCDLQKVQTSLVQCNIVVATILLFLRKLSFKVWRRLWNYGVTIKFNLHNSNFKVICGITTHL